MYLDLVFMAYYCVLDPLYSGDVYALEVKPGHKIVAVQWADTLDCTVTY